MNRLLMLACVLALAAVQTLRADLLITKDRKSTWISSYEKKTAVLNYKTSDGAEQIIPLSQVDMILPSVQPGGKYTPEQADSALEQITRAIGRYATLRKQLELLKQQWQQVKDPDTGADGKINQLIRQFDEGDKSARKFQDIAIQMEMIALRDSVGTLGARIKQKVTEMQQEVFDTAKVKIEAMAGAEKKTVENYVALRRLVLEVRMVRATAEQKKYLDDVLEKCRKATMDAGLQSCKSAFFASKSIDGYLASMAILDDMKQNEVAVSAADKAEIDRHVKVILGAARTECTSVTFAGNGYPLDAKDKALLAGKRFDSAGGPGGLPTVEHCYLLGTGLPANAKQGDTLNLPLRLIFNRTPVPGRKYSLLVDFYVPGNSKREIREVPVEGARAGHVDTELKLAVPVLPPKVAVGALPWNGLTGVTIVLAYQGTRAADSLETEWIAASGACRLAVGVPEVVKQN